MLYAGLPVFITRQSDTPELLNHQPFVVLTDYAARGAPTSSLDVDFKRFLNLTRHLATVEMDIRRFLTSELLEEKVYGRVCEQMGLCKPSILVHIGIRGNHR